MEVPPDNRFSASFGDVHVQRWPWSLERTHNLDRPYVTAGNRVYSIATQHGEFTEIGWRQPSEMSGVWDHPIKLLDGFWFGITFGDTRLISPLTKIHWLTQATNWRMTPGQIEITYHLPELEVIRREYGIDDYEGMQVRIELLNRSSRPMPLTLHFLARTDLRSAWLGADRLTWRDGKDEAIYVDEQGCIAVYNTINPAYVLFGAQQRPASATIGSDLWATQLAKGQGISGRLSYRVDLPANASQECVFIIAGSTISSEAVMTTYLHLQAEADALRTRQQQRYEHVLERSALHSDDALMDTAFGWAKITLQMLERNVPGIGQGLAGGLPDYPWWFGSDTAYSTLSLVASGQFELALSSLRNLAHYSQAINGNGAVVHEILTQGHVHDNGQLVETPLFVRACYHAFRWTGDREFLQELYDFCKRGLLEVVLGMHDPEGSLFAKGRSMIDTRELQADDGMKTLDIAAYTYEALLCLAEMALEMGDEGIIPMLRAKAQHLHERVNTDWWIETQGLYGDIYISAEELAASHQIRRAEKLLWTVDLAELDRSDALLARFSAEHQSNTEAMRQERPWLLKHMIAATPMDAGLATPDHANQALNRLETDEFTGPWGLYLNPETQRFVMSLPNSLMAVSEARYGRMDQSLAYCHKIASTFSQQMPGAFSDFAPGGGCFIQAWSSYGIIWPVVHSFLGFQPDAARHRVHFVPHLPSTWHTVRLQDVRVGAASMNLYVHSTAQELQVLLETSDLTYEIVLGCTYFQDRKPQNVTLNGTSIPFTVDSIDEPYHTEWCTLMVPPTRGLQRSELLVTW